MDEEKLEEKIQYKCDKCGATFTDPEMLEEHKKVHQTSDVIKGQGRGASDLPQGQLPTPPASPAPEPLVGSRP